MAPLPSSRMILSKLNMLRAQVGTYSDIRDQRYRTEPDIRTSNIGLREAESDIISDIGMKFYPVSNIRHPLHFGEVSWLSDIALAFIFRRARIRI
jgi:hypothetical protein